ncbi:hypothetical protein [Mycobacterium lehmannii]|uniref:hypothetical protein n=1 Tax=Mycobacterium lehmannii TaxID=2048550 RepID=UPI000B93BAC9|nr:hypothetical protein [Mycobacterium lehmannii]
MAVDVSGPAHGHAVVMLQDPDADSGFTDAVRARLHVALLRTVVITAHRRPQAELILNNLRRLGISWSLLIAHRGLGPLAWTMAARHRERFSGLIVVDCGHPRVADAAGTVVDPHCPPVVADTTALVSDNTDITVARASGQYVHGQFRLAKLAKRTDDRVAQLVTEIVLHTHS